MADGEIVVNGVAIGLKSDLVAMFRRALQGESVFPSKTAFGPEDGVVRVLRAAQGSDLEPRVREAIMTLLSDVDPKVRAGAAMAIAIYPRSFDGLALFRILDRQPSLFRGVASLARSYPDVEWELLIAIAATKSTDPHVLERLKAAVTDPANGGWVVGSVTKADPGWVVDHARDVVAGQPSRVNAVLANLKDPQKREQFIAELREESDSFRKDAAARLDRVVTDPRQRERLAKLLTQ